MIYDHRTYVCRPGTIKQQLALYEAHGWDVQRKHLGEPVLYAMTETGNVNAYTHVWSYENAGERERKRAAMQADPQWQEYMRLSAEAGNLVSQENKILMPTPFFQNKS